MSRESRGSFFGGNKLLVVILGCWINRYPYVCVCVCRV